MTNVLKILAATAAVLCLARAIVVGIDHLYKKYGRHYIEASGN